MTVLQTTAYPTLEASLAYTFREPDLLERALTHRSWAHEYIASLGTDDADARTLHNEAFEFLGDSVLGFVVAEFLLNQHTDLTEGEYSRMKHQLVSTKTLADAAKRLELGKYLRFGRGEEKTGGRRKQALLADVFEAVIAAVYLDGGIEAARGFIYRSLQTELAHSDPEEAAAADYKTMLQERLQATCGCAPSYEVIESTGPPHRRTFRVEARWEDKSIKGEGRSIKAAEIEAARRALNQIDEALKQLGV